MEIVNLPAFIICILFLITFARLVYCEVRNKHVRGVCRDLDIKLHNLQVANERYYLRLIELEKMILKDANLLRMLDFLYKQQMDINKSRGQIIEALNQEVNEIEAAHKKTVADFDKIILEKDAQIERLKNINFNLEHNILDHAKRSNAQYEENIRLRDELAKFTGDPSEH